MSWISRYHGGCNKSPVREEERAVRYEELCTEAKRQNKKAELLQIVDLVVTGAYIECALRKSCLLPFQTSPGLRYPLAPFEPVQPFGGFWGPMCSRSTLYTVL